jgi:hypothetical protein
MMDRSLMMPVGTLLQMQFDIASERWRLPGRRTTGPRWEVGAAAEVRVDECERRAVGDACAVLYCCFTIGFKGL